VNLTFFENQDFVWGVALMISGAFIAFSVIRYGAQAFRKEVVDAAEDDWRAGPGWALMMKYLIPLEAVVLLVWWLWQAARVYAPDSWYNPFDPFSVMTCLAQWAVAIVAFISLNRWLNGRMLKAEVQPHA